MADTCPPYSQELCYIPSVGIGGVAMKRREFKATQFLEQRLVTKMFDGM